MGFSRDGNIPFNCLTCYRKIFGMQLNIMPKNGITLSQICGPLIVQKSTCCNANYTKHNMFLYSCKGIGRYLYEYCVKTMLRHSDVQSQTYPRKRVYECPSWRIWQHQHRKHHQALGSILETKMMIRGSPYWSITPTDHSLMGRPC